ncbi:hypothetical protein F7725_006725 [Dissostichus mawsoni]|uniref:Uncharacterized protein n=1 Tax=Dissostichus mawsoni TaxID=36200 RepID=A0A7J5XVN7_DISMA|nr:hypothetical protein F7725_006725 [Dissostichus mawsoni]
MDWYMQPGRTSDIICLRCRPKRPGMQRRRKRALSRRRGIGKRVSQALRRSTEDEGRRRKTGSPRKDKVGLQRLQVTMILSHR